MPRNHVNLVIVAHPDDEILGFGGTGARLVAEGETVQPIILSGKADARTRRPADQELLDDMIAATKRLGFREPILGDFPNIRMNNVDHLDVVRFVESQVERFSPRRLITHHPSDLNDDHRIVFRATLVAARLSQRRPELPPVEELLLMEVPSSTDWGYGGAEAEPFKPDTFVDIGPHLEAKLEALGCYRGVVRAPPHSRSLEALRGLATVRGAQAGMLYAEAFQTIYRRNLG
ncbi:MAG: PIG-L family deacetylase [Sphingosinicella sp.]|nr:PIG-L family deacetylase [Sphingosinicella sp.]